MCSSPEDSMYDAALAGEGEEEGSDDVMMQYISDDEGEGEEMTPISSTTPSTSSNNTSFAQIPIAADGVPDCQPMELPAGRIGGSVAKRHLSMDCEQTPISPLPPPPKRLARSPADETKKEEEDVPVVYQLSNARPAPPLPPGWTKEVQENSGMPVYRHEESGVFTASRPYVLTRSGTAHDHHMPLWSVPCLAYRTKCDRKGEKGVNAFLSTTACKPHHFDMLRPDHMAKYSSVLNFGRGTLVAEGGRTTERRTDRPAADENFAHVRVHRNGRPNKRLGATSTIQPAPPLLVAAIQDKSFSTTTATTQKDEFGLLPHHRIADVPMMRRKIGEETVHRFDSYIVLNTHAKTSLCVLHEYAQKVLKTQMTYSAEETRNTLTPYCVTVRMSTEVLNVGDDHQQNDISVIAQTPLKQLDESRSTDQSAPPPPRHGKTTTIMKTKSDRRPSRWRASHQNTRLCVDMVTLVARLRQQGDLPSSTATTIDDSPLPPQIVLSRAHASSKKMAKVEAARLAMLVLVPGLSLRSSTTALDASKVLGGATDDTVSLFDAVPIDDDRVVSLCAQTRQLLPFAMLQEILRQHCLAGKGGSSAKVEILKTNDSKQMTLTLSVGEKHRVQVVCANKRDGREVAAQKIIKQLHGDMSSWGALMRHYAKAAQLRLHEQQVRAVVVNAAQEAVNDQAAKRSLEPNDLLLSMLRAEMDKYYESQTAGKATPCDMPPPKFLDL